MGIKDSEIYRSFEGFAAWYKELAFKGISQIPYGRVPAWKAFADGKVEETLKEDRSLCQSIKEYYVMAIVSVIAAMVSIWYFTALIGLILIGGLGMLVLMAAFLDPIMTAAAVLTTLIFIALLPAASLLVHAGMVHLFAKALGGIGSLRQTASVIALSAGACLVLMIPMYIAYALVIGLFLSQLTYVIMIFALYLQYRGIKHVHKLSRKRAAAAVAGPLLLSLAVYMAVMLAAILMQTIFSFAR